MKRNEKTFTHIVNDYIKEKRAIGYNFEKGAQTLRRIIHLQNGIDHDLPILSEELSNRCGSKRQHGKMRRIEVTESLYLGGLGLTWYEWDTNQKLFSDDWHRTETTRIPHISFPNRNLA